MDFTFTFDHTAGTTGLIFNAENPAEPAFRIEFEPQHDRVAAYQVAGGNKQEVTRVPFGFRADSEYKVEVVIDGTICVVYIDGKAALSSRIYGLAGKEWGIFAKGTQTEFKEVQIHAPE
ncbi:glycoside hydrolase domain-containing protein [Pontibacter sp. 13R65]|uniref:glycoside hydrolase domain-containing protein n=1 Tax=Pontibacter sp. 13R65 TaxID=3127458 RepID=UPI00301E1471